MAKFIESDMYMALFFPGEEISSVNIQVIGLFIWFFPGFDSEILSVIGFMTRRVHARFEVRSDVE